MIRYSKGEINEVVVTLNERVTIDNPFFLLVLTNKSTEVVTKTFVTDFSLFPNRYNLFRLNLPLATNDFLYEFFQKSSADDTNIEGARLLESGLLKVNEQEAEIKYYEPS